MLLTRMKSIIKRGGLFRRYLPYYGPHLPTMDTRTTYPDIIVNNFYEFFHNDYSGGSNVISYHMLLSFIYNTR